MHELKCGYKIAVYKLIIAYILCTLFKFKFYAKTDVNFRISNNMEFLFSINHRINLQISNKDYRVSYELKFPTKRFFILLLF